MVRTCLTFTAWLLLQKKCRSWRAKPRTTTQTCTTCSAAASVQMWPSTPRTSARRWRLTRSSSAPSASSSCCCSGWRARLTPTTLPSCSWHRASLQWRWGIPSPHPLVVSHPVSHQSGWWWRILPSALVSQTSSTSFIQVPAGNRPGYSFPILSWRSMCITLRNMALLLWDDVSPCFHTYFILCDCYGQQKKTIT